jgi:ligand-binding sensor domain-containing protein
MMLGVMLVATLVAGPLEVHTATTDVRDCRALDDGDYVAATDGGVVFLDRSGVTETTLTAFDGLPETRSHVVERVHGSPDEVWVGTEAGLARIAHDDRGAHVIASHAAPAPVRAVLEHDGHTYVGTWGAGVLELRGGRLHEIAGPELARADRVTDLAVHDDRIVVASAGAGAWVLGETAQPLAGIDGMVWTLAVHDGSLYAGTFAGVLRLDDRGAVTVSDHDARALASVDDALLIGSRGQGLARLGSSVPFGLPSSHVQGLDQDRCVATSTGLWIRDGRRWIASLTDGLPSGDVTDVLELGDRLVVSTFDRGVSVYEDGRWSPLPDPDHAIDPQVNALADAGQGRIWVATARGLHRVGPDGVETWTEKRGLPHASVLSLAVTRSGELLVGTHAGVAILDANGDARSLGSRARSWSTWAITEAPDGEIWLGTTQGVIRWKHDGRWEHLSMLSGHLSDNWVTSLLFDKDVLHVGTYAGGVDTLTRDGDGETWRGEALGGGRVNPGGLSLVDGELFAATMKGVLVHRGGSWKPAREQGVFEDATAVLETDAGTWVGSRRGMALWRSPSHT